MISIRHPKTATRDRGGLEVLDWDECLSLAGTRHIGRLGVSRDALPIIMPVAFATLDRTPTIKVGSGAVQRAVMRVAVCCFELDSASPTGHRLDAHAILSSSPAFERPET